MTTSEPDGTKIPARRSWNLGVRARLLLAFFAIAGFAVLAAAGGIFAFREVGGRLDVVEARLSPTLSAFELSRSAERIIAAAPALLAAPDRARRDAVKDELAGEVRQLNSKLRELKAEGAPALPLERIEPVVTSLTTRLGALEQGVAHRLEASERIRDLRRQVFQTNGEVQRLLAPWLEVTASEIASLVEGEGAGVGDRSARLTSLIEQQRLVQAAQRQASAIADMLAEASTTATPGRLTVLDFQIHRALGTLETTTEGLDPRLRRLFLERVAALRGFAELPDSTIDARRRELALIAEGEERLAEITRLSAELTSAVDRLGGAARGDIGAAIRDALSVQRLSTRALVVVVILSLVTSILIVWLYVEGNIVRRLTSLSDGMLAIAGGRLRTPVAAQGSDEIAAMGRAVEIFRQNAIELERLLEERKETATRLERTVAERTRELSEKSRELEIASRHKSHFLASASHDLRQPLHALNLFVAQLHAESEPAERGRLVERIDAAVGSMNELFESLLDMSRLEAGILEPDLAEFPIQRTLARVETTFAETAGQKALRLRVVPSRAWVRSDPVLLERMLMNLVANAVRCTARGGVVVGCRRRDGRLRIDVCDSGPGISGEERRKIFGAYYRLVDGKAAPGPDRGGGFGLGLAIVDRLGRLLDHEVSLDSRPGRGSRFSVSVPLAAERRAASETILSPALVDPARGKLVVVIDDDPLVLEGMAGILESWGCRLLGADSEEAALAGIREADGPPDLIISDYRLAEGRTGIQAIGRLRDRFGAGIPAFLISGDTAPDALGEAREHGIHLLHKPVPPMRLRAMLNQFLKPRREAGASAPAAE